MSFKTFKCGSDLDRRLRSPDRATVLAALDEAERAPHPALEDAVCSHLLSEDFEIGGRAAELLGAIHSAGKRPEQWPIDLGTDGSPESIAATFDAVWEEVQDELVADEPSSAPTSIEAIEVAVREKFAPERTSLPLDYRRYLERSMQHGWISRNGMFHLSGAGLHLDGYRPGIVIAWWYDDHFVFLDPREQESARPIKYYNIDEDEDPYAEYPSFSVWLLTEMRRRRR
ncbi:hypothetical protein OV090_11075 [Nannocystis sp. RBIL2]|uniref:hypothetical protein n=1 Tax=Nannocystis sp. RBIL2 TaxID=2996788 RepID=UPI0022707A7E|nr:hypothetical protein [Nannocystis sp. RBIL2]MCY1065307.1 hypothetical protein [Nannocystis sp. RBIL2]